MQHSTLNNILLLVYAELQRATTKFPYWPTDPIHAAAVVAEESGELSRAVLMNTYEKHKVSGNEPKEEAVQTIVTAIRFLAGELEGKYSYTEAVQYPQSGDDIVL